jgi:DNA-binding transcriptional regulator YiaG
MCEMPNKLRFPKHAVRPLRVRLEWTQAQLAAQIGVTQGMVSQWENDELPDSYPRGAEAKLLQLLDAGIRFENFSEIGA